MYSESTISFAPVQDFPDAALTELKHFQVQLWRCLPPITALFDDEAGRNGEHDPEMDNDDDRDDGGDEYCVRVLGHTKAYTHVHAVAIVLVVRGPQYASDLRQSCSQEPGVVYQLRAYSQANNWQGPGSELELEQGQAVEQDMELELEEEQ